MYIVKSTCNGVACGNDFKVAKYEVAVRVFIKRCEHHLRHAISGGFYYTVKIVDQDGSVHHRIKIQP